MLHRLCLIMSELRNLLVHRIRHKGTKRKLNGDNGEMQSFKQGYMLTDSGLGISIRVNGDTRIRDETAACG